jgi:hypothetical protein
MELAVRGTAFLPLRLAAATSTTATTACRCPGRTLSRRRSSRRATPIGGAHSPGKPRSGLSSSRQPARPEPAARVSAIMKLRNEGRVAVGVSEQRRRRTICCTAGCRWPASCAPRLARVVIAEQPVSSSAVAVAQAAKPIVNGGCLPSSTSDMGYNNCPEAASARAREAADAKLPAPMDADTRWCTPSHPLSERTSDN